MNRLDFIYKSGLIGLGTQLPSIWTSSGRARTERITVIHTNDVHSRLDPFPVDGGRYSGRGGLRRRAQLIEELRKENEHVLLLDAGDIFQGTPYFNMFKGEPEMKAMSLLSYDAATMGNHDFDNGLEGFESQLKHASFPIICSNYDFRNTVLDGKTIKRQTIKRGKLKIGLFGLGIELSGLVPSKLFAETKYLDPLEIAEEQTRILKEDEKCDLIICLSHLGYKYQSKKISDMQLAKRTSNIDLIIGGHTHTFLEKASVVKNKAGGTTLVNQAGWGGLQLGVVQFEFNLLTAKRQRELTNLEVQ